VWLVQMARGANTFTNTIFHHGSPLACPETSAKRAASIRVIG
jgi:hypothetical protein